MLPLIAKTMPEVQACLKMYAPLTSLLSFGCEFIVTMHYAFGGQLKNRNLFLCAFLGIKNGNKQRLLFEKLSLTHETSPAHFLFAKTLSHSLSYTLSIISINVQAI